MDNTILKNFTSAGLSLVPIPPIDGKPTKGPQGKYAVGWNKPRSAKNPNGHSANFADFNRYGKGYNFGLFHGASGTLALDLDDLTLAKKVFEELTDIQLLDWLESEHRAEVISPKPNRAKLLFKLPSDFIADGVKQCKKPKPDKPKEYDVVFELRCGNGAQDVIAGEHPDYPGQEYQFIGDPAAIPEAPAVLLDMLQHWDAWKPCFDDVLGVNHELPKEAPRKPQQGEQLPGWRNPIQEFNQAYGVTDIPIRNGYKQKGRDRLIRPGSESKAPGVAIMRNCADGIERVYSHGGDVLNDGFAHDAFDCYRLLECGGDWAKALNWNSEITKHNQQQERVKKESEQESADAEWQGDPWLDGDELGASAKPAKYIVNNILETDAHGILGAQSQAFKSFLAIKLAHSVCTGKDFFGHEVFTTGPVLYICGEGAGALQRRIKAAQIAYGSFGGNLKIWQGQIAIDNDVSMGRLRKHIEKLSPVLAIFDTFSSLVLGELNENDNAHVARVLRLVRDSCSIGDTSSLIVHHYGKSEQAGFRGASAFFNNIDFGYAMKRDGDAMTTELSCVKMKDGEMFKPLCVSAQVVELGLENQDGSIATSLCLENGGDAKPVAKKRRLSARDDAILTSLFEAIAAHGVEPTAAIKAKYGGFDTLGGRHQKIVSIEHWRDFAYPRLDAETTEAKQTAFRRARSKLFELGKIVDFDGYWWPIFD